MTGLDLPTIDANVRIMSQREMRWGLPNLPNTVKADVAAFVPDSMTMHSFLNEIDMGISAQLNAKPDPERIVSVQAIDQSAGPTASGLLGPSNSFRNLAGDVRSVGQNSPIPLPQQTMDLGIEYSGRFGGAPREYNLPGFQGDVGQLWSGLAGVADPLSGQRLFRVKDENAVIQLKMQAIEMGLVEPGTPVDGTWSPEWNGIMSRMAQEDFNRQIQGTRPGATSIEKLTAFGNEWLSPSFLAHVSGAVAYETAMDFVVDFRDVAKEWDTWQSKWDKSAKVWASTNASAIDKGRALVDALTGPIDDIVAPVANVLLLATGITEVAMFVRGMSTASKAARAAGTMTRAQSAFRVAPSAAEAAMQAKQALGVGHAVQSAGFFKRYGRIFNPTKYKSVDAAVEIGEYMRIGRILQHAPSGVQTGVTAWRSLKPVMLARKTQQQVWRMGQFNLMINASGMENSQTRAVKRIQDYRSANPQAYLIADLASGADFFLMPRNIYPLDTAAGVGGRIGVIARQRAKYRKFMHATGHSEEYAEAIHFDMVNSGHMGAEAFHGQWKHRGAAHAVGAYYSGSYDAYRGVAPTRKQIKAIAPNEQGYVAAGEHLQHSMGSLYVQQEVSLRYMEVLDATGSPAEAGLAAARHRTKTIQSLTQYDPNGQVDDFLAHIEQTGVTDLEVQRWKDILENPLLYGTPKRATVLAEVQSRIQVHNAKVIGLKHQLAESVIPGDRKLYTYLTDTAYDPANPEDWHPFWNSWEELADHQTNGLLANAEYIDDYSRIERQVGESFPLGEMLAPGGDPVIRERVLGVLGDGTLSNSPAYRDNSLISPMSRPLNVESSHQFAIARLETVSKNQMLLFLTGVKTLLRQREAVEALVQSSATSKRLARVLQQSQKQGVDLSTIDQAGWTKLIKSILGRRKKNWQDLDSDDIRYLARFLEGKQGFNAQRVLNDMDVMLGDVADSGAWSDIFRITSDLMDDAGKSSAQRLNARLNEGRRVAYNAASEVRSNDPTIRAWQEILEKRGYKLVYGMEFHSPAEMLDGMPNMRQVTANEYFNQNGRWSSRWVRKLGYKGFGWALNPGEKRFNDLIQQNMADNVARELYRVRKTLPDGFDFSPEGPDVQRILQGLRDQIIEGNAAHQTALDSAAGVLGRTMSRIGHSTQPRSILSITAGHSQTYYTARWDDVLTLEEYLGKKGVGAVRKGLRNSSWLGDLDKAPTELYPGGPTIGRGKSRTVLNNRGPLLGLQDWFVAKGAMRGTVLGGMNLLSRTSASTKAMSLGKSKKSVGIMAGIGGGMVGAYYGENLDDTPMTELFGQVPISVGAARGAAIGALGLGSASVLRLGENLGGLAKAERFRLTSKVASATVGGYTGGVTAEDENIGALTGSIIGGVAGPAAMNQIGKFRMLERGMTHYNTLPYTLNNLGMALRFSLSPLFDMQRYTEGISLSFIEDTARVTKSGQVVETPLQFLPVSRRKWMKQQRKAGLTADEATVAFNKLRADFDHAGKAWTNEDSGFEIVERSVRRWQEEGLMGFNPMDRMLTTYDQLVKAGYGKSEAYEKARKIFTYGVQGRTTGELTVNALFFPFSFQARFVGRWAQFLADDTTRAVMVHDALRTYDLLDENYDLSEKLKEHVPLMRDLQKVNALAFGISAGEFGGLNRPFMDFFIPLAAYVVQVGDKTLLKHQSLRGSMDDANLDIDVDFEGLTRRILPAWRDITQLIDDLEEQGHVIFGENHITREAEADRAWAAWRDVQGHYENIAHEYGFNDWNSFSNTRRATASGFVNGKAKAKSAIADQYPVWEQTIADAAARKFLADKVLAQRAENPKRFVDYEVQEFMHFLNITIANDEAARGFTLNDTSTIPPDVFQKIRSYALTLSARGNGFEKVYGQHYRKIFGPIERSQWVSMPTVGLKMDERIAP